MPTDATDERVAAARAVAESFLDDARTADPTALQATVRRLEELRGRAPAGEVELLYRTVAGVVGVRTRQPYASRHLDTALRLFDPDRYGADGLLLECALLCALSAIRPHEARTRFADLVDRLAAPPARRARLLTMLGLGDAWSGDLVRGQDMLARARLLAIEAGRVEIQAEATSFLAKVEALRGDTAAAGAYLGEARDLAARAASSWVAAHIAECAVPLHLVNGDVQAWAGVLEFLVGTNVGANSGLFYEHRWELATHRALSGDAQAALALLAAVPDPPLEWPGAPALPAWRQWISAPDDPEAMARFERSLTGLNRPVERLSRARMAWLLGERHARLGRRADAIRLLETAASGYAAMGAGGPLARVTAVLDSVTGPAALPVRHDLSLTPTELRVAQSVAMGLSNRETAAQLGVSAKTVEFHLANIFRKLAVRNRTELAASLGRPART
ncbi:LuxR C-terminal-related transcriptional regulator [Catellatospora sp. KI3]|uniref:helix-turn-helix transcriptional regulator n=1 Tax=Catellatospora sp. KI3 TaxID=3041620 RepID=UPI00248258E2|nr:LuxR family transcriptional regulator [Catellatospora sp. KI3]MDI1462201.1 LuxR C-terminal-related transcriptional regulator [Catellatospora sp. KI3]